MHRVGLISRCSNRRQRRRRLADSNSGQMAHRLPDRELVWRQRRLGALLMRTAAAVDRDVAAASSRRPPSPTTLAAQALLHAHEMASHRPQQQHDDVGDRRFHCEVSHYTSWVFSESALTTNTNAYIYAIQARYIEV